MDYASSNKKLSSSSGGVVVVRSLLRGSYTVQDGMTTTTTVVSASALTTNRPPAPHPPIVDTSTVLKERFPESTPAERHRFLKARQGNVKGATANLQVLMDFRQRYRALQDEEEKRLVVSSSTRSTSANDRDHQEWLIASRAARRAETSSASNATTTQDLPRLLRVAWPDAAEQRDNMGHRILYCHTAQLDDSLGSVKTYAVAIASYLDRALSRDATEQVCTVLDLRGGPGWANPAATTLVPFLKELAGLLLTIFPERLSRCIVFPLPRSFTWIASLLQRLIDPATAQKICLVAGSAHRAAPLPLAQLVQYLDESVVEFLEQARQAAFRR